MLISADSRQRYSGVVVVVRVAKVVNVRGSSASHIRDVHGRPDKALHSLPLPPVAVAPSPAALVCRRYEVLDVAVLADNSRFVSCGEDKAAFLWDVTSGSVVRRIQGHEQRINSCCFSADGDVLFTASYDKVQGTRYTSVETKPAAAWPCQPARFLHGDRTMLRAHLSPLTSSSARPSEESRVRQVVNSIPF